MPPKLRFHTIDKDDLVWQKLDEEADAWIASICKRETCMDVGHLILKYKEGKAEVMHAAIKGGYNIVYRLEYKDGSSAIMRIPIKGTATATQYHSTGTVPRY